MISAKDVASKLWKIGAMLELTQAPKSESKAFYDIAKKMKVYEDLVSLEVLLAEDFFSEYPKVVQETTQDFLQGIEPTIFKELSSRAESSASELLRVTGIGAKRALEIYNTLGISTLEELKSAAQKGKLLKVKGIGKKKAKELKREIKKAYAAHSEGISSAASKALQDALEVEKHVLRKAATELVSLDKMLLDKVESVLSPEEKTNDSESATNPDTQTTPDSNTSSDVQAQSVQIAPEEKKQIWFSDVLQTKQALEPGMEVWEDNAVSLSTGEYFAVENDVIDFVGGAGAKPTIIQSVMESKLYSRFYEEVFRPGLTRFVTARGMNEDIELSKSLLSPEPSWKILDMACGTGNYSRVLAKQLDPGKGFVIGVDLSIPMLKRASEFRKKEGLNNLYFIRANAMELPVASASMDAVNCTAALHLFESPMDALEEFYRILKPGGKLVVGTFLKSSFGAIKTAQGLFESASGFGWFEHDGLLEDLRQVGFQFLEESINGLAISVLLRKPESTF